MTGDWEGLMFCPFCGSQNRDDKKFCRVCGRLIPTPRSRGFQSDEAILSPSFEPSAIKNSAIIDPPVEAAEAQFVVEDQLNEPTGQLLPDTVDFQMPKDAPSVSTNGSERSNNGSIAGMANIEISSPADLPLSDQEVTSGEFMSTDELEMDKTLDKTVETPVLTSADIAAAAAEERASERAVPLFQRGGRPLFSFMSSGGAEQSLQFDRSLKVERIILIASAIAMLAGMAMLIWLLVLKQ
jgi:hypothetical protein